MLLLVAREGMFGFVFLLFEFSGKKRKEMWFVGVGGPLGTEEKQGLQDNFVEGSCILMSYKEEERKKGLTYVVTSFFVVV